MGFSKSFAKNIEGEKFPKWEEVLLSKEEELLVEEKAREENVVLMIECLKDAKKIVKEERMEWTDADIIRIAVSLFEKRASHVIYHKEEKAKEKFDLKK